MRAGGENSQFTQTSQSATQLVMEEELQEKGGMFRDFLTSRVLKFFFFGRTRINHCNFYYLV